MGLNLSRPMLDGSAVFEKSCNLIISLAETGRIKWWKIDGSESESPHATQSTNVGYSNLIQIIRFQPNLEIDIVGRSSMGRLRFSTVKKWLIITILFIVVENLSLKNMSFPFRGFHHFILKKSKFFDFCEVRWSSWDEWRWKFGGLVLSWGMFSFIQVWECSGMLESQVSKMSFALVFLIKILTCELSWMGSDEGETWPVEVSEASLTDARDEGASSFQRYWKVRMSKKQSSLRSDCSPYLTGKGGQSWDGCAALDCASRFMWNFKE